MTNKATFKPLDKSTAQKLADLICVKNLNGTFDVDGKSYTLVYVSRNSSQFFRSRGLSAYFKVGRSIVRVSDHWAKSEGFERSRKLNCGSISGKLWEIEAGAEKVLTSWRAGKYSWELLAGICGLSRLNKTCDHFTA
jgi:hypothetical protein